MAIVSDRPVLVVDDEFHITHAVSGLLKSNGRACVATNDPGRVMEMIDEHNPRVLLLDINMEESDGIEICRSIRSQEKYDNLIIIMMTALGSDEDKERGLEAGADEYILKPFHPMELKETIDSFYK